jgi:hypothetical protein
VPTLHGTELWAVLAIAVAAAVVFSIAHRAAVRRAGLRRAAQIPMALTDPYGRPLAGLRAQRIPSEDFPAYPRPANGGVRPTPPPPPPPPAAPTDSDMAPPSWQVDPSGRYHYRWWTGSEWTSYVATDGHVVVDTSPDQRIGPY